MFCLFRPSCLSILPPFLLFLFNVHWSFVCMKGVRYTGPEAADSCGSCRVDAGNWSQVSVRAASECFWATSSASLRLFWKGTSTFKNSLDLSEKEWFLLATHKTPRRMTKKWNLQHKLATTCSKGLCFQSSTLQHGDHVAKPRSTKNFLTAFLFAQHCGESISLGVLRMPGTNAGKVWSTMLNSYIKKNICMYFDKVFLFLVNGAKVC